MPGLSSSAIVYATDADLEAYLGRLVDNTLSGGLLARASAALLYWTRTARYSVDPATNLPTDQGLLDAFHDACIYQAAAYLAAGIAPGDTLASQPQTIQSKSLGGRSVTYAQDTSAASAKASLLAGALSPEAAATLSSAGLLGSSVVVGGAAGYDILLRRPIIA